MRCSTIDSLPERLSWQLLKELLHIGPRRERIYRLFCRRNLKLLLRFIQIMLFDIVPLFRFFVLRLSFGE